jgi:fatty acid desaturase
LAPIAARIRLQWRSTPLIDATSVILRFLAAYAFRARSFIIAAWFALLLFFWPGQPTTLLVLIVSFAVIYALTVYTHIFGDRHHARPLIPIIIVGFIKLVGDPFIRGDW